jgi:predicted amidohydrolase
MKIGYCQFNVAYADIDRNLQTISHLLEKVSAELIVLPELCMSGYYFTDRYELQRISVKQNQDKIIKTLNRIARSKQLHIVAGISETENDNLFNTALIIGPNGVIGKHRKVNLTTNETLFTRGDKCEIFEIGQVKIGIAICFESWFPESFRLLSIKGAQIICCPSNFGGPWTLDVMKVRALENSVYTIMCNRIGYEHIGHEQVKFRGESQVIDVGGNILIQAQDEESVGIVDVNPGAAKTKENIICIDMEYERQLYSKYVSYSF